MVRASDNLALVPDDDESDRQSEDDAEAEQALLAAFASARGREQREVAAVEVPRYQGVPQRDASGRLTRDADGKVLLGSLVLFFQALAPGRLSDLRQRHTHSVPVKRRGRTEYEDRIEDEELTVAMAYMALLPWCRQRYFDNPKLWGDEPVGTGQEFMAVRLKIGELSYCVEAIMRLQGLGDEREEQLGKPSAQAAP